MKDRLAVFVADSSILIVIQGSPCGVFREISYLKRRSFDGSLKVGRISLLTWAPALPPDLGSACRMARHMWIALSVFSLSGTGLPLPKPWSQGMVKVDS
ncbi:hypothetical protein [Mesorhizobium carmichaelinearum]|uniref:hypothetical protein n=1 Tax=Mesorhizobium carmichaelinearum TaxID=1208188 RepID=UPI001FCF067E|nr:hypothetical protein [Mesorhizobium carmichaelinearum]